MRHQKRVAKLGRTASHRKALMGNLAAAMIKHGKIKTTDAKAKELRRVVERLITMGKKGTVHHRRQAFRVLQNRSLVKTLFGHIAPQYKNRQGGYTRIIKLGFRDNDNAAVSLIEFVDYKLPSGSKKAAKAEKKAEHEKTEKPKTAKSTAAKKKTDSPKAEKKETAKPKTEKAAEKKETTPVESEIPKAQEKAEEVPAEPESKPAEEGTATEETPKEE